MTSVFNQDLGSILDNYADVIEGGNTWRGSGTVYKGIPGKYPTERRLRDATDSTLTVSADVSTTVFEVSTGDWDQDRWVSNNGPPFFVLDQANEIRKITAWDNTTKRFTVAPALTTAPVATDTLSVFQGYKRLPNKTDIESDEDAGQPEGWDRFFHLSAAPGEELAWYGDGHKLFQTELELRLRLGKYGRLHDWTGALLTDVSIMRAVLPRQELYPSFVRALYAAPGQRAEVVKDDDHKIVVVDKYTLVYDLDGTYA